MDGIWDGSSDGTMVSLTAATGSRCFGNVSTASKGYQQMAENAFSTVSFYVDNCLIYNMITINRTSCLLFANSLTTMSA